MKSIKHLSILIILFVSVNFISPVYAGKYALVIGNGSYKAVPALNTPANDAIAMASILQGVGFSVQKGIDLTQMEMEKTIRKFGNQLSSGDTALFYYSGHGSQIDGINYLIPVEIPKDMIKYKAVPVNVVLDKMEEAGSLVNIIILDACRDNPFNQGAKGFGKGLAAMTGSKGTFIAYATSPGTEAYIGAGTKSIYTNHLANYIGIPGLRIEDVFMKVREAVITETENMQIPWESSSLVGSPFYFSDKTPVTINTPAVTVTHPDTASHVQSKPPAVIPKYRLRSSPMTVSGDDALKVFDLKLNENGWRIPVTYTKNDFNDNGDGTITDNATGLMWQKSGSADYITYEKALSYVEEMNRKNFAGYSDWRLPTVDELKSLIEPSKMNVDLYIDPIFDITQRYCWTSDSYGSSGAWIVDFTSGLVYWNYLESFSYVRLVRP